LSDKSDRSIDLTIRVEAGVSRTGRDELLTALVGALREQAGRAVVLHGLIAERAGLGPADVKALDLARGEPELTAGRLAELTGLTRSAVTTMIDRLEERGYVRRRRDDADRRRVTVEPTGKLEGVVSGVFDSMTGGVADLLGGYSDSELELLTGFVERLNAASARFTAELPGR
jgi:DNA-binding MarR family transcriptional regulator